MKKFATMAICFVLIACMVAGGSLAYLTDRDSEANVFTVGDVRIDLTEDFEKGATLTPGVDIEKAPKITNKGINDAWVWMEFAIPSALDTVSTNNNAEGSSDNVVHWNYLGATATGYANADRIQKAFDEGKLTQDMFPAGVTNCVDFILSNGATWNFSNDFVDGKNMRTAKIADGKELAAGDSGYDTATEYNVYVIPYNKALEPGETTLPGIVNVYLDANIDIDNEGNWYHVEKGVVKKLDWNTDKNGAPIIYVSAYAIQEDGFADVKAAYAAYTTQWTTDAGVNNGSEWAKPADIVNVSDSTELAAAIANTVAGEPVVIKLADGEYETNVEIAGGSDITIQGNGEDTVISGQIATTSSTEGTVTLKDVTVKVDASIVDSTGISQTGKSAIAIWGNQTVICENVTFDMSLANSTAITSWWDTGVGTSIIVKDCTFNCNGQRPIRATGNVTVENCTFNDPYRYAVQLTAKASTATELDKAIINFNNNTIVNGANGKDFVYGIQLEGADYGCNNCVINGAGNTIENGGTDSTMYYCECGKVVHDTIKWNVEATVEHETP